MRLFNRFACILFVLTAPTIAFGAGKRASMDEWFYSELVPTLAQQLNELPRLKGQVFRFVVLDANKPVAVGSRLEFEYRDTLRSEMVRRSGVKTAWYPVAGSVALAADRQPVNCSDDDAQYYVGIEIEPRSGGKAGISVRVLDIVENHWVADAGGRWTGRINEAQRRALKSNQADATWTGQRATPYRSDQIDLLAEHLAHDLGCSLLSGSGGEYIAAVVPETDAPMEDLAPLVGNYLSPYRAVQIVSHAGGNSELTTRAQRVDGDLYQYWVTVSPLDPDAELRSVSASAYVRLNQFEPALIASRTSSDGGLSSGTGLLQSFKVVRTRSDRDWSGDRYALQATTGEDAVLFFLHHQLNHGLVRLADGQCPGNLRARISRQSQPVQFSLAMDSMADTRWVEGQSWPAEPEFESFYVIGSSDSRAGRALARHIEKLPQKCGASLRAGMTGSTLRNWFDELEAIATHWSGKVDWKSVRVKEIY